ncbi:hypothetical protein [Thermococcus sp.]|nr:hypothetical protein [Thermococcus sp.]
MEKIVFLGVNEFMFEEAKRRILDEYSLLPNDIIIPATADFSDALYL